MDNIEKIKEQQHRCLKESRLDVGKKKIGKVRDVYELEDKIILVSTDRQSAFDRILAEIPFKGQVLNQTSTWWFKKTSHIIANHVIDTPDPNVTVAKKCTVFPVEFIVRGYITGSTSTSAWLNYEKGVREFCGNTLPEGMKKNQKFERPIVTPTTKSDEHDRSISPSEIIKEGLMTQEEWNFTAGKALELFRFGQAIAEQHGLILVDTKYEFGKDSEGNIILIDEIHTPDSSRYWIAKTYDEKFTAGLEPENIDKEFLRLWFVEHCDPYNDTKLPPAPEELIVELSRRYIQLYEMITDLDFVFPNTEQDPDERITSNLTKYIRTRQKPEPMPEITKEVNIQPTNKNYPIPLSVVIIMGSEKDKPHAQKIIDELNNFGIQYHEYIASAHKQAGDLLFIMEKYKDDPVIFITIAGRSNALSGFVAGNSDKPVIACPPFADKLDMLVNIHSTLQMPSNVPVMTILEPGNVALAVDRIFKLSRA